MEKLFQIFQENNGRLSSVRVNSFIALLVAIGLSFGALNADKVSDAAPLILSWLVAAFAPKVVQKFAEKEKLSV